MAASFASLKAECLNLCSILQTDIKIDVLDVKTEVFTKNQGFSTKATVRIFCIFKEATEHQKWINSAKTITFTSSGSSLSTIGLLH